MAKVWDKPITADTDWGGDASTENLPVSGRQVQAWIKSNIKSDAQISQLIVSWLNKNTINSPAFWKGLPIDADTLKWENNTLTVIGSDGETESVIDEEFLINFLKEYGYITTRDYPFVYDAEKKVWLFTGDIITTGAITMFGSIEGFTPSTIMDAVQVDGRTIVKNAAGQLVAIGGGGSGGGLVVDDVNALIEAALVPVQEEIGLKWTEDSDSIYRWNLAYSWGDHSKKGYALKSYVDDELTKYILLDTAQDVNAQHNFKKGLFIDGLPITKVNSNTIFLDANLVIGGAITMFGNNSSTFKAIWENIPFNPEHMTWDGSQWNIAGGGGSSINEAAVNLLIGEYLTNNNYASEQWVTNALDGYATQSWVEGKKYLTGITSSQVATALGYTPYNSSNPDKYIKGIDYDMVIAALGYTPYSTTNPMGYLTISSLNGYATEQWVSNQAYAKQSSLNGVDNRLKSVETFFATSDTDNLVNKWSEIVTFLNATEGDTLDKILKTKANQSALDNAVASLTTEIGKKWTQNDVKIANWDSAYGWGNHANAGYAAKTYVDGELAKYVKLATAQTISARHNFSDGLQIGGITIRKSQDGVVYIDGNLVIKGALTMFGTDTTIPSSIWASIPFDSTMEWTGSVWRVKGGGSGSVDDARVNVLISEYLTKNSYATQSWVGDNYLLKSGGTVSGNLFVSNANLICKDSIGDNSAYFGLAQNTLGDDYIGASIVARGNRSIYFATNGSLRALITPSGNVAFGGTTADARLHVHGDVKVDGHLKLSTGFDLGSVNAFLLYDNKVYIGSKWYNTILRGSILDFVVGDTTAMQIGADGNATINGSITATSFVGNLNGAADSANATYRLKIIASGVDQFDLNTECLGGGLVRNYSSPSYWKNAPAGLSYGMVLTLAASVTNGLHGQFAWDVNHASTVDTTRNLWWRANDDTAFANSKWHQIAFTDSNVASATKLETPRTIWGQSFNGEANVTGTIKYVDVIRNANSNWLVGEDATDGNVYIGTNSFAKARILDNKNGQLALTAVGGVLAKLPLLRSDPSLGALDSAGVFQLTHDYGFGMYSWVRNTGDGYIQVGSDSRYSGAYAYNLYLNPLGGNVAVGDTTASAKLHVHGAAIFTGAISTPQINIGGIAISKSQDDTLFIDANVVVRGAITMFGMNTTTVMGDLEERLSILERKVNQLTA